jgi:hypothetical protein
MHPQSTISALLRGRASADGSTAILRFGCGVESCCRSPFRLPIILEFSEERGDDVRMVISCFLAMWLAQAQEAAATPSQLIEALMSDNPSRRESAAAQLLKKRALARPELEAALTNSDADFRLRVRAILRQMDLDDEEDSRASWVKACSRLPTGLEQAQVEEAIHKLRNAGVASPRRIERSQNVVVYNLDRTWQAEITYSGKDPARLESVAVFGFADFRKVLDPTLYPLVQMVHESPSVDWKGFDPVVLIRTVNALQALGTDRALRVCEAYDALAVGPLRTRLSQNPHDKLALEKEYLRTRLYDLNEQRLIPILRLLFVRRDEEGRLPSLGLGLPSWIYDETARQQFPLFPLALQDDIPYLVAGAFTPTEARPGPLEYIRFCRATCKVRDVALTPTAAPTDAVDALTKLKAWKDSVLDASPSVPREQVRAQALRAIASIYPPGVAGKAGPVEDSLDLEKRWERDVAAVKLLHLFWDAKEQAFKKSP